MDIYVGNSHRLGVNHQDCMDLQKRINLAHQFRQVLSMPGSAYHSVAKQIAEWLSVVPEAQINSSYKMISDIVKTIELENDEELVSFDVSALQ